MYVSQSEILKGKIKIDTYDESCIYFLISGDEIIYIGQTVNFKSRYQQHRYDGKEFDYYYVIPCDASDMDAMESFYIHTLRPSGNGTHRGTNDMRAPMKHRDMYDVFYAGISKENQ